MLFEFKGKVYEINTNFLIILGIIGLVIILYLLYLSGGILINLIPNDSFNFNFFDSSSKVLNNSNRLFKNNKGISNNLNENNLGYNNQFDNQSKDITFNKSNNIGKFNKLPYEVQTILKKNKNPTDVVICSFNGHGRIANINNEKFDCRKTEDLKIINFRNKNIYCCVTP